MKNFNLTSVYFILFILSVIFVTTFDIYIYKLKNPIVTIDTLQQNKIIDSLEQVIFYQNIENIHNEIILENIKEIDSQLYYKASLNVE